MLVSEQRLDQPDTAPVPLPVREVVLRRIARLPQATAEVLSVAAVAGRLFDIEVVAEAASVEVEAALEAIDAAVAAGLVVEDQQPLGWFRFTHALVAETFYEAIGRLRRVHRHRRIGVAAARIWAGHDQPGRGDRPALAAGRRTRSGHCHPSLAPTPWPRLASPTPGWHPKTPPSPGGRP